MLIGMADGVLMLVVDTCGAEGSVALAKVDEAGERVLGVARMPGRSASERLLTAVRSVLAEAGRAAEELGVVAVVRGPGSFTGVRIGVATAKGLAEGVGVPVIGLSRLAVMAAVERAREGVGVAMEVGGREVMAVLEAGREEVFCGRFGGDGEVLFERLMTGEAARAAGVGARVIASEAAVIERVGAAMVEEPDAIAAAGLAAARWRAGRLDDVETLDALYLRRTAAEIALGQTRVAEGDRGEAESGAGGGARG